MIYILEKSGTDLLLFEAGTNQKSWKAGLKSDILGRRFYRLTSCTVVPNTEIVRKTPVTEYSTHSIYGLDKMVLTLALNWKDQIMIMVTFPDKQRLR